MRENEPSRTALDGNAVGAALFTPASNAKDLAWPTALATRLSMAG